MPDVFWILCQRQGSAATRADAKLSAARLSLEWCDLNWVTVMDDRYKSDIPADAIETSISEYKQEGGAIWPEKRKCTVDGVVVGYRYYEHDGSICIETPIKNGKKHGIEYSWECREDGPVLSLSEPYENGLIHGTAKQWAFDGSLLGTYTLYHGKGYDIW